MWMSDPIPVTTRIMTADSGSSRSVKPTFKSPDVIHAYIDWTSARPSGGRAASCQTSTIDIPNDASIAAHATAPAAALLMRRPQPAFTRKPRNGSSGIRINMSGEPRANRTHEGVSPFQTRKPVGVQRFAVAEQADDNRQADGRLGGG